MDDHPRAEPRKASAFGWRAAGLVLPLLAALWWLFARDPGSWIVGLPTVLIAAGIVGSMPVSRTTPRLVRAPGFVLWFLWQSVRSGVDVALRALRPTPAVAPGLLRWRTALPEEARVLFANTITLLPGTLTASLERDRLEVHALDQRTDVAGDLGGLEGRIAALTAPARREASA